MTVDILAFGAHPDDVEIGVGGTLIKHRRAGYQVAIIDLTGGEMGSNGTAKIRKQEAEQAGEIIGVEFRKCLGLPDSKVQKDEKSVKLVVEEIRKHRPRIVLAPYWEDRHPDHVNSSLIITEACFKAGLRKFAAGGKSYRPQAVAYYFLGKMEEPDFIVDISKEYETKVKALLAHDSQVNHNREDSFKTVLNNNGFIDKLESRFKYLGSLINAETGEGFKYKKTVEIPDLMVLEGGV